MQTHVLQDLIKGSKIMCELSDGSKHFIFDHPDGTYSYCVTEKGNIFHPSRFTPLEKNENGTYKIYSKKEDENTETQKEKEDSV